MTGDASFGRGGLNPFLDVDELIEDIGLSEHEIAWRKDFIGFDGDDEHRLEGLESLLVANQEAIANDFYENLLQYEQTREVIERSPKGVEALKQTQRAYLVSLATGEYDQAYFKNRARIGKLHELLDMPLKHYVGQYGVYYDLIMARLNERVQDQVVEAIEEWAEERDDEPDAGGLGRLVGALGLGGEEGEETTGLEDSFENAVRGAIDDGMLDVLSLLRIINLDLQVATDTYVDSYAQRLEASIERRERLAKEVQTDIKAPIDELHEASGVIAERAETISTHTTTQAETVDEAAGELSDVSAAVEEIASVTAEVRTQSERTEQLAAVGTETADDALEELTEIEAAVEAVSTAATSLEERTAEIDSTLSRLDDLARRTTLLAKNAKIESSRGTDDAGAADTLGIIAEEVESFAAQTQADLREIESAVEAVTDDAEATIAAATGSAERVNTGAAQIRKTIDSLETIYDATQSTAAGMDDVAAATDQQATSLNSVADSIDELSVAADRVANDAASVAAASEEQTASLQTVRETVDRLMADDKESPPVYEQV